MLRVVLVFLAGVLVGANAVYYLMTRPQVDAPTRPATTVAAPSTAPTPPASPARMPSAPRVVRSTPIAPASPASPAMRELAGLIVPVQGMLAAQLSDTYAATRSQGRSHDAIDIMAAAGTPVLAVADGTVEKLFDSKQGGLTIYQFEPSGTFAYYYAHLDRYAAGLAEGKALRQGEVIGYVGSTGNASPDAPHLHFAVFVLGPQRNWWQGAAINPYPLLAGRLPAGRSPLAR